MALPPAPLLLFHSHLYIEKEFSAFAQLAHVMFSSQLLQQEISLPNERGMVFHVNEMNVMAT